MKLKMLLVMFVVVLGGCMIAPQHASDVGMEDGQKLTVGTVQKEIKTGMSGAEVVSVLGSPNIVSSDSERREVWVYDKVATDVVHSSSSGWVFAVLAGGRGKSGAMSRSQRTLTIIIKFDKNNKVRDFAYHSSKF